MEALESSLLINYIAGCGRDASGSRWKPSGGVLPDASMEHHHN